MNSNFEKKVPAQNALARNEKVVIYTAIIGGYDMLRQPSYLLEGYDYICFSDQPIVNPGVWQVRVPPLLGFDNIRLNRFIKLMPHLFLSEYQKSIYIDGNIEIIGDVTLLLKSSLQTHPIAVFAHPFRKCIYEEARQCIVDDLDNVGSVFRQIRKYARSCYPSNYGLVEANILFRRHNDVNVMNLMEGWWQEILENSRRDQISFNYVCWKKGMVYQSLGLSDIRIYNPIFKLHPHSTSKVSLAKTWRRKFFRPLRKLLLYFFPVGK